MPLTDVQVRNAKPREKPYKLSGGKGLYLYVTPAGGRLWRLKYRHGGKEKLLTLGVYGVEQGQIGLKEARALTDQARNLLREGVDPGEARKAKKAAQTTGDTFEAIAREWFAKQSPNWAVSHASKTIERLERDIFPWIGSRSIAEIKAPDLLAAVRRIENRGALETAHRALANCGQICRYAVATGRADRDPSGDLRGALPPVKGKHFAAITEPLAIGELLRAIDAFKGTFTVQCALRLAPMLFVRPGELRKAEWADFDIDKAEWRYVVSKTKTDHVVPLADQALAILRDLHPLTGTRKHVFPGRDPKKPMSEAAINAALRRMGYDTKTEVTGHGFRAMARTVLHETLGIRPEVIEHQLAHRVPDALGTAYNRTLFLSERKTMMQQWADYLDKIKVGAEIIPLRTQA